MAEHNELSKFNLLFSIIMQIIFIFFLRRRKTTFLFILIFLFFFLRCDVSVSFCEIRKFKSVIFLATIVRKKKKFFYFSKSRDISFIGNKKWKFVDFRLFAFNNYTEREFRIRRCWDEICFYSKKINLNDIKKKFWMYCGILLWF